LNQLGFELIDIDLDGFVYYMEVWNCIKKISLTYFLKEIVKKKITTF